MRALTRAPLPISTLGSRLAAAGAALAALTVLLPPLLVLPAIRDPFRLPKLLGSESLALLSLVLLSLAAAIGAPGGAARSAGAPPPRLRLVAWTILPCLLVASAGLATSAHGAHVRSALASLWIAAAALAGWCVWIPERVLRRLIDLLILPAAALAVIAVLQFHDLWQPFAFAPSEVDPRTQITSLAGNVADLGAYLVLPLLVAQARAWEALDEPERPQKGSRRESGRSRSRGAEQRSGAGLLRRLRRRRFVLWSTAGALCLYALALTQTLAALGAAAASSFVLWLVLARRRGLFLLAAAALAAAGALALQLGPLRARVAEKMVALQQGDFDQLLTGRLDGWRTGLFMARSRPLTGVGHGAFAAEFVPAKLALLERGVPFFAEQRTVVFANAHHEAIEVAAEWGVPGLLAAVGGFGILAGCALRLARRDANGALALAALVSYGVLSSAFFPLRLALTGYPAVLLAAWILAASVSLEGAPRPERPTWPGGPLARVAMAVLVALAVAASVLQTRRVLDRGVASAVLQRVETATAAMTASGRALAPLLEANRRALLDARERDPAEPAIPIALGAQYFLLDRHREAIEWYERALALEPRPETYFSRGAALLRLGDEEAAIESYRIAVRLNPLLHRRLPRGIQLARPSRGTPGGSPLDRAGRQAPR